MSPSNDLINEWLMVAEVSQQPRFLTFATLAAEWGAKQEREACAEKTGEFARKWWSIHCATNKHMETTRKAHDDFCALQVAIRSRGEVKP